MTASLVFVVTATAVVGGFLTWCGAREQVTVRKAHARWALTTDPRMASPTPLMVLRERLFASRRSRAIDSGLGVWLDASARSARAGASLRHALLEGTATVEHAAAGELLTPFVDALQDGESLRRAIDAFDTESTSDRRLVGRALRLAVLTGGPTASMLDAVATTLHERAGLSREVHALATQARASAVVMVAAPIVFSVGAMAADPGVSEFLRSAPGVLCIGLGVVLDLVGAAWMSRLVRAAS